MMATVGIFLMMIMFRMICHGTQAGIISASPNNNLGVSGFLIHLSFRSECSVNLVELRMKTL